jgi:hypothetical protein
MFYGATLSTANYDALLIGWDAQSLQSGVTFHGGNSTYCAGEAARANMISSDSWTINDAGKNCTPTAQSPRGNIADRTPTFTWTKVSGATSYRFQLKRGSTTVYTKTVASSACGSSTCSNTPTTTLGYNKYKWRVRAKVGGVWGPWSSYKTFTVIH